MTRLDADRKKGEFAVVVADEYQGKGLGAKLTDMLINVAEEKGARESARNNPH